MLNYKGFKGRTIDINKAVKVYKNLHSGLYSVQQCGLVVAHVESIVLTSPAFKVSQAGRLRVIKEGKKNVHAFIVGYVESVNTCVIAVGKRAITYNPYKYDSFVYVNGCHEVYPLASEKVYLSISQGLFIYQYER